ncbi:MAG: glycosyltransferase family 9 protein [Candidatus Moranbacteria bacterium]|nr:glycosyltransferase family 9 protein [Candidatus Moranbacteria bacterium]
MQKIMHLGRLAFIGKKRSIPKKIDKILFFKIGALGDILMTTPLIRAIRRKFPNATIDYVCGKSFAKALEGNKNINFIIEFDEKTFFNNNLKELKKLQQKLKENKYDIVFVLDKHWAVAAFTSFIADFRIGFDRNGEGFANNLNIKYNQNRHDIDAYLDMALYFQAREKNTKMDLVITNKDKIFAKKICKKNAIAIAPGGGINTGQNALIKIWPKERYLEIIGRLSKNYNIILVGDKNDKKISSWITKHAKNKKKIKDMCGRATIKQTAAIMELCKFIVCNDSGAMHIASCVNDKIISIFGPTNPHVLAPLNKGSVFIWKEKKACYDIYGNFGKCKKGIMEQISAEDVLNATRKFF